MVDIIDINLVSVELLGRSTEVLRKGQLEDRHLQNIILACEEESASDEFLQKDAIY